MATGGKMMKAIGLYRYLPIDDPESLVDLEVERPEPSGCDLLVRVEAIAVNPLDVKVRAPKAQTEATPRILGWDVAGVVEAVGPDCRLFRPGGAVYYAGDLTRPGGNSTFHLVDERIVGHKPVSLDFAQAAALPLTTITAWEGLFERLGLTAEPAANQSKSMLIIGAAGGVGSIATQLAKWAGLTVIGTSSREESTRWVREHGVDHIVDHSQPLGPQVAALGHTTVDYIFCLHSTDRYWDEMAALIAPQGKICAIVWPASPLDLSVLMYKSATFAWEFMFTRSMFQTADMVAQHALLNRVAALVDSGVIRTTLTEQLSPITAATLRQAHARVETGRVVGKIVLAHFPSAADTRTATTE